jgi:thioredoxin-related protein
MRNWWLVLICIVWFSLSSAVAFAAGSVDEREAARPPQLLVPAVEDLTAVAADARRSGAPILLVFAAEDCEYCQRLESEVLGPMRLAGVEPGRVILRKVMVEDYQQLRDFQGHTLSASSYARRHKVRVTPTIALVNAEGEPLVPNIVGYQSPDFYPAYLEQAIDVSRGLIAQKKVTRDE